MKRTSTITMSSDEEGIQDVPTKKKILKRPTGDLSSVMDISVLKKPSTKIKKTVTFVDTSAKSSSSDLRDTSETSFDTLLASVDSDDDTSMNKVAEFEQPTKEAQNSLKRDIMALVKEHKIRDLLQWRVKARIPDHPVRSLTEKLVMKKTYEQMITDCCKAAIFMEPVLDYKHRLVNIPGPQSSGLKLEDYEQIVKFANNFEEVLKYNGLDPHDTFKEMFDVLFRTVSHESKIRTIYFHGPASCGKSSLMLLLSSVYEEHEIGKFSPLGLNSQFWLDDLYGKEIYIGDEAKATPLNIQVYLLLLEGNRDMKTEIKYGGKPCLEPKPVMLACNTHIFADCHAYAQAVLSRVLLIEMKRPCPRHLNIRPERNLYPFILRVLAMRHWKNDPNAL